jgi:lysophospholipase L1-like esterase
MTLLEWSVGTAAAALVLAELGARRWIRRTARYYVWAPGTRSDLRLSPDISPRLDPRVRFEVNRDGERGNDLPENEPDENLCRILVAGGSCVESLLVDQAASWPGALEHRLASPDSLSVLGATRVHVGNVGRSGVAARELDLIFERTLPRYRKLDVIVIMVGAGDVVQWLERGAPSPYPATPISVHRVFGRHPEGPFGWRPTQWALVELLRRLRQRWLRPVEVWKDAGAWYARARAMRASAPVVRNTVPDPEVMLQRYEHDLERLLQRARVHARRVLLVRQPWFEKDYSPAEASQLWHGGVGIPWRELVTTYYSPEVLNRLLELVDARGVRVAERLGITHLDVRPALAPSLDNYYDLVHFTPAGSAIVANAIASALLTPPTSRNRLPGPAMAGNETPA